MSHSDSTRARSLSDKGLTLAFDTATDVSQAADRAALAITDTFRLKPLVFWGLVAAAAATLAAAAAVSRR